MTNNPFIDHVLKLHEGKYESCVQPGPSCTDFLYRTVMQYTDRAWDIQFSTQKKVTIMPWAECLAFELFIYRIVTGECPIQSGLGPVFVKRPEDLQYLQGSRASLNDHLISKYDVRAQRLNTRFPVIRIHTATETLNEVLRDIVVQQLFPGATYETHVAKRTGRSSKAGRSQGLSPLAQKMSPIRVIKRRGLHGSYE
jgi:hypothetical protein